MGNGIKILNTVTQKCKVTRLSACLFKIILTQGLNRQIRRMCATLNYNVMRLVRTRIMTITLEGLTSGNWRNFSDTEIVAINQLLKSSVKTEEASLLSSHNDESFNG